MTNLTQQEFDDMAKEFLATQDDGREDEWYTTNFRKAERVLNRLRTHLFAEEIHTTAERMEYLRLKAKYEMS